MIFGDKKSCQLTNHEFNLANHMTGFDENLVEDGLLLTGKVLLLLLVKKEELNAFKASKTQQ